MPRPTGNHMDFSTYQKKALTFASYPNQGNNPSFIALGLAGETGEVADKIKKLYRDRNGTVDDVFREEIKKELGDVLWYLAMMCTELGLDFGDVAHHNLTKIASRQQRGVLRGDGDTR